MWRECRKRTYRNTDTTRMERPMSGFQAIADRVEIEALRGEFTDAAMMRDGDRLAALFTHDGVCGCPTSPPSSTAGRRSAPGANGWWRGGTSLCRPRTRARSQLDGDTAAGRAYIQELVRARDGIQGLNFAIYHDRYLRTPDGWKFTERVYEVGYLDTTPLAGSAPT